MSIKEQHRDAKKPLPSLKNDICKTSLDFSKNQGIPYGKGFQRVRPTDTYSTLKKLEDYYKKELEKNVCK